MVLQQPVATLRYLFTNTLTRHLDNGKLIKVAFSAPSKTNITPRCEGISASKPMMLSVANRECDGRGPLCNTSINSGVLLEKSSV